MASGWLGWRAWAGVAGVAAAAVGVAGVALCDIHLRFTWQAWYVVTSTFTLRGRRGTYGIGLAPVARLGRSGRGGRGGRRGCWRGRRGTLRHPPWFHVAGVVLGDIDLHFAWQAWHVWHWAGVCKIRQLDFFSTTSPNTLSMAPFAAVIVVVPQDLLSCTEAS